MNEITQTILVFFATVTAGGVWFCAILLACIIDRLEAYRAADVNPLGSGR